MAAASAGRRTVVPAAPRPATARGTGGPKAGATGWRARFRTGPAILVLRLLGLPLAATILGSILAVGTSALLLARETPLFTWLGQPLVPVLALLGIPDAGTVGPAVLVGVTEMYIPALLVTDAAAPARFFVAVLSVSQLIFFSSLGPMVLDMFREIPVRARELLALFLMRTALLVPVLAGLTALLRAWGIV